MLILTIKKRFVAPFRRMRQKQSLPSHVLILLTIPRSGSTWFSDAIRSHPRIEYHPSAGLCESLRLKGYRRYPMHLSNGPDGELAIEIQSGRWEKIPLFRVGIETHRPFHGADDEYYAIEKLHPEDFGYNGSEFLNRVARLEKKGIRFRFIYQVRDPEASMISFLNYQKRSPEWYQNLKGPDLASYMVRTYETLLRMFQCREGIVFDYSELQRDFQSSLLQVYRYLWSPIGHHEEEHLKRICHAASDLTSRTKRVASGTPFLGDQPGPIKGSSNQYREFFEKNRRQIDLCTSHYEFLLSLRHSRPLNPNENTVGIS